MAELETILLPAVEVPVTMMLYVPIEALLAAVNVIIDLTVPPAGTLIPPGLKETDRLPLVNCAARYTVPA